MAAPVRNVFRELDELSQRLAKVEAEMGLRHGQVRTPAIMPAPVTATPADPAVVPVNTATPPPHLPPIATPIPAPMVAVNTPKRPTLAAELGVPPRFTPPASHPKRSQFDIERLIGGRWYAVIGAIIMMIGFALFLKLAYDQGWMDRIPGGVKCGLGAIVGVLFVGMGEIAFRKLQSGRSLAAAALTATGLGVMYASAYAAHALYTVVPLGGCFVLLALISCMAIALAIRQQVATVGVIGFFGAYAAPLLMSTGQPSRVLMPVYLLFLLASGLVLSAVLGRKLKSFVSLRVTVWWGTVLLGSAWAMSMRQVTPQAVLLWVPVVWAMMHGELLYWARHHVASVNANDQSRTQVPNTTWSTARAFMTSFSSTAWCVLLGTSAIHAWSNLGGPAADLAWLVPAVAAVVTGGIGFVLSGHLRILRDIPETLSEKLGASLLVQCGALLIVAVVLGVSDWAQPAALLVMGVGAAAAARWMKARSLYFYGACTLVVASVRICADFTPWSGVAFGSGFLEISRYAFLSAATAVAWFTLALFVRSEPGWKRQSIVFLLFTVVFWSAACAGCAAFLAAFFMCLASLCLLFAGRKLQSLSIRVTGAAILLVESVRILTFDYHALAAGKDISTLGIEALGITFIWWGVLPLASASVWFIYGAMLHRLTVVTAAVQLTVASRIGLQKVAGVAAYGVGFLMAAAVAMSPWSQTSGLSLYWAILVLAGSFISLRASRDYIAFASLPIALAAGSGWIYAWVCDAGWDAPGARVAFLIHLGVFEALVVAMAFWFCSRAIWKNAGSVVSLKWIIAAGGIAAGLLLLLATSFDAARIAREISTIQTSQRAGVSIWWGICGMGLIVTGFWKNISLLRHSGLGLLGLAVAKALIWDLAGVPQVWRVASFIGLGLMMLAVSVVYAKLGQRLGLRPSSGGRAD